MKTLIISSILLMALGASAETGVTAKFHLSPGGNFDATSKEVKGECTQTGEGVAATNVTVLVSSLKTGIELRDKHMQEKYLESEKFPQIELLSASGKDGKGTGKLRIHGVEKEVEGTYALKGNEIEAQFPIKLSDFKIDGIRYMGVGVKDDAEVIATLPVKKVAAAEPVAAGKKTTTDKKKSSSEKK